MTDKPIVEIIAAENKSIGFEYQYYFFLSKLLSLRSGQTIGYEVLDDVHIQHSDGSRTVYQLKHTLQKKADGTPINLTEFDIDLWKTLSTWSKNIQDPNTERLDSSKQKLFIDNTQFVLATNKSISASNNATKFLKQFKSGEITCSAFRIAIGSLRDQSKNSQITRDIADVLNLSDELLNAFIKKVSFQSDLDELISQCKSIIREDKIPENKIDEVFRNIDSAVREHNYWNIKKGNKITIDFDQFYRNFRRYYDLGRNEPLSITEYEDPLPNNLADQIFIKQLLEIGDLSSTDTPEMFDYTRQLLKLHTNINRWVQNGELTPQEIDGFDQDVSIRWKNIFRSAYRAKNSSDSNDIALTIVDKMRNASFSLSQQELGMDLSNGEVYRLSNTPTIGWRADWEKYKK